MTTPLNSHTPLQASDIYHLEMMFARLFPPYQYVVSNWLRDLQKVNLMPQMSGFYVIDWEQHGLQRK